MEKETKTKLNRLLTILISMSILCIAIADTLIYSHKSTSLIHAYYEHNKSKFSQDKWSKIEQGFQNKNNNISAKVGLTIFFSLFLLPVLILHNKPKGQLLILLAALTILYLIIKVDGNAVDDPKLEIFEAIIFMFFISVAILTVLAIIWRLIELSINKLTS